MAIDDEIYRKPAIQGDVAGVAIHCSLALRLILSSINSLSKGVPPPQEDLDRISQLADILDKRFENLAGWEDDDD